MSLEIKLDNPILTLQNTVPINTKIVIKVVYKYTGVKDSNITNLRLIKAEVDLNNRPFGNKSYTFTEQIDGAGGELITTFIFIVCHNRTGRVDYKAEFINSNNREVFSMPMSLNYYNSGNSTGFICSNGVLTPNHTPSYSPTYSPSSISYQDFQGEILTHYYNEQLTNTSLKIIATFVNLSNYDIKLSGSDGTRYEPDITSEFPEMSGPVTIGNLVRPVNIGSKYYAFDVSGRTPSNVIYTFKAFTPRGEIDLFPDNKYTITYVDPPVEFALVESVLQCPNRPASNIRISLTLENLLNPNNVNPSPSLEFIENMRRGIVAPHCNFYGLRCNTNTFIYYLATAIVSMYNVSTSRICNATSDISYDKITPTSNINLSFYITDNIVPKNNIPGNKTDNDYLSHECIAKWIDFELSQIAVNPVETFVRIHNDTFPIELQSLSCPALRHSPSYSPSHSPSYSPSYRENFEVVEDANLDVKTQVVSDASKYNPKTITSASTIPTTPSTTPAVQSNMHWYIIGIVLLLLILGGIYMFSGDKVHISGRSHHGHHGHHGHHKSRGGMFSIGE